MQQTFFSILPILLFVACAIGLAVGLLVVANLFNPVRPNRVKGMPYESGMDPVHDTHRRFDIRFYLLAIAFLVFDVELLFLYPWAVALRPAETSVSTSASTAGVLTADPVEPKPAAGLEVAVAQGWVENRNAIFIAAMVFLVLLTLGYVYDWRKGVFDWR